MSVLRFTVNHRPVSINAGWTQRARGRGVYLTPLGRAYKRAVSVSALVARQSAPAWSQSVAYAIELSFFNSRADVDNCTKFTVDALQKVLFRDDRQVRSIRATKCKDSGLARVEIEVRYAQSDF